MRDALYPVWNGNERVIDIVAGMRTSMAVASTAPLSNSRRTPGVAPRAALNGGHRVEMRRTSGWADVRSSCSVASPELRRIVPTRIDTKGAYSSAINADSTSVSTTARVSERT